MALGTFPVTRPYKMGWPIVSELELPGLKPSERQALVGVYNADPEQLQTYANWAGLPNSQYGRAFAELIRLLATKRHDFIRLHSAIRRLGKVTEGQLPEVAYRVLKTALTVGPKHALPLLKGIREQDELREGVGFLVATVTICGHDNEFRLEVDNSLTDQLIPREELHAMWLIWARCGKQEQFVPVLERQFRLWPNPATLEMYCASKLMSEEWEPLWALSEGWSMYLTSKAWTMVALAGAVLGNCSQALDLLDNLGPQVAKERYFQEIRKSIVENRPSPPTTDLDVL